jgi:hypothetical protein
MKATNKKLSKHRNIFSKIYLFCENRNFFFSILVQQIKIVKNLANIAPFAYELSKQNNLRNRNKFF